MIDSVNLSRPNTAALPAASFVVVSASKRVLIAGATMTIVAFGLILKYFLSRQFQEINAHVTQKSQEIGSYLIQRVHTISNAPNVQNLGTSTPPPAPPLPSLATPSLKRLPEEASDEDTSTASSSAPDCSSNPDTGTPLIPPVSPLLELSAALSAPSVPKTSSPAISSPECLPEASDGDTYAASSSAPDLSPDMAADLESLVLESLVFDLGEPPSPPSEEPECYTYYKTEEALNELMEPYKVAIKPRGQQNGSNASLEWDEKNRINEKTMNLRWNAIQNVALDEENPQPILIFETMFGALMAFSESRSWVNDIYPRQREAMRFCYKGLKKEEKNQVKELRKIAEKRCASFPSLSSRDAVKPVISAAALSFSPVVAGAPPLPPPPPPFPSPLSVVERAPPSPPPAASSSSSSSQSTGSLADAIAARHGNLKKTERVAEKPAAASTGVNAALMNKFEEMAALAAQLASRRQAIDPSETDDDDW